jgi:hypothetical protein
LVTEFDIGGRRRQAAAYLGAAEPVRRRSGRRMFVAPVSHR